MGGNPLRGVFNLHYANEKVDVSSNNTAGSEEKMTHTKRVRRETQLPTVRWHVSVNLKKTIDENDHRYILKSVVRIRTVLCVLLVWLLGGVCRLLLVCWCHPL